MRWLHVADYITWKLCGEAATDYSVASRTMALDLANRSWAVDLIRDAGINPALFAPLAQGGTPLAPQSTPTAPSRTRRRSHRTDRRNCSQSSLPP